MAGDIAAAQKTLVNAQRTANSIKEQYYKEPALTALAEAQLISGDIVGAQKTSDQIQDAFLKRATQQNIDQALAARHNVIAVSDWLKKLDDENESSACPLSAAPFLDVASHLKSLPPSDDPWKVFERLHATADTIISAQNVIAEMLKQQAKQ